MFQYYLSHQISLTIQFIKYMAENTRHRQKKYPLKRAAIICFTESCLESVIFIKLYYFMLHIRSGAYLCIKIQIYIRSMH